MRASMISGGSVTLGAKLQADHGWSGSSLLAAPIAVVEAGAVVDTGHLLGPVRGPQGQGRLLPSVLTCCGL